MRKRKLTPHTKRTQECIGLIAALVLVAGCGGGSVEDVEPAKAEAGATSEALTTLRQIGSWEVHTIVVNHDHSELTRCGTENFPHVLKNATYKLEKCTEETCPQKDFPGSDYKASAMSRLVPDWDKPFWVLDSNANRPQVDFIKDYFEDDKLCERECAVSWVSHEPVSQRSGKDTGAQSAQLNEEPKPCFHGVVVDLYEVHPDDGKLDTSICDEERERCSFVGYFCIKEDCSGEPDDLIPFSDGVGFLATSLPSIAPIHRGSAHAHDGV